MCVWYTALSDGWLNLTDTQQNNYLTSTIQNTPIKQQLALTLNAAYKRIVADILDKICQRLLGKTKKDIADLLSAKPPKYTEIDGIVRPAQSYTHTHACVCAAAFAFFPLTDFAS